MSNKLILTVLSLAACLVSRADGFVSASFSGANCMSSLEPVAAGSATASDGMVFSHGTLPLFFGEAAGIKDVSAEFDNQSESCDIYTLDGRFVKSTAESQLSDISLEPGLYIVRQGHKSFKLFKTAH